MRIFKLYNDQLLDLDHVLGVGPFKIVGDNYKVGYNFTIDMAFGSKIEVNSGLLNLYLSDRNEAEAKYRKHYEDFLTEWTRIIHGD